jgi:hypothetical protein
VGTGVAAFSQAAGDEQTAMRVFTERIDRYARLRSRLEEPLPPFVEERRNVWSSLLTRRYLASAIRTARYRAQLGDIFEPPVAAALRRVLMSTISEIEIEGLVPDEPAVAVDLTVNEPVPAWALSEVPGPLVARLPALPEGIEYRMVNGSLILWDRHADILIDALPHAFVEGYPLVEDGS